MSNILLVDDEQEVTSLLKKRLEKRGFSCCEAGNGQEALDALVKVTDEAAVKEEGEEQAKFYHSEVFPAMEALRAPVDKLEMIVDKEAWPMPSYGDLIFEV